MVMNNAWNGRNPAIETKGGTGNASYAQGDLLYASATNTLSRLGIGGAGTVLTSNGTIPTWGASMQGSLINLYEDFANSDASHSINSVIDGTYNTYLILCTQVRPLAGDNQFRMRVSTNNGSSFLTGSSDYTSYCRRQKFDDGTLLTENSSGENRFDLTPGSTDVKNSAGAGVNLAVWLFDPFDSNLPCRITWKGNYLRQQTSGSAVDLRGSGKTTANRAVNSVQFRFRTNDILSGFFSVYGVNNS